MICLQLTYDMKEKRTFKFCRDFSHGFLMVVLIYYNFVMPTNSLREPKKYNLGPHLQQSVKQVLIKHFRKCICCTGTFLHIHLYLMINVVREYSLIHSLNPTVGLSRQSYRPDCNQKLKVFVAQHRASPSSWVT